MNMEAIHKNLVAGVDPGFSGAISILDEHGAIILNVDMPIIKGDRDELDEQAIRTILANKDVKHVFIEKVSAMPGEGVVSVGRFMAGWGIVRGICAGLQKPYTLVHPLTWKKKMMRDMPKDKGASIIRVKQLYPDIDLPRKKDHGKADAILIALYGVKYS